MYKITLLIIVDQPYLAMVSKLGVHLKCYKVIPSNLVILGVLRADMWLILNIVLTVVYVDSSTDYWGKVC